jgi:hypothetical protein
MGVVKGEASGSPPSRGQGGDSRILLCSWTIAVGLEDLAGFWSGKEFKAIISKIWEGKINTTFT